MEAELLAWFDANGRDLPWRRTRDPYAILVSEVMRSRRRSSASCPRFLALARALADRRRARGGSRSRRHPRVAGARLQPPRALPPPGGAADRGGRLARRSHRAPRRRPLHRRRRAPLRLRDEPVLPRRHERRARRGADAGALHAPRGAGAHGPRPRGLPRTGAALRRLPPRTRSAPPAGAATSRSASSRPSRARSGSAAPERAPRGAPAGGAARRGGRRRARARRARRRDGRAGRATIKRRIADIVTLLIPVWILLGLIALLGVLGLLGRIQNGRYLTDHRLASPRCHSSAVDREGVERGDRAVEPRARERDEEDRADRRIERPDQSPDGDVKLTSDERRALLAMQDEQGSVPEEATNRQMRRRMEKARRDAQRRGR